jgi:hypothetical protein
MEIFLKQKFMKITAKQKSELEKAKKQVYVLVQEQERIYEKTKKLLKTADNGGFLSDYLFGFADYNKLEKHIVE